MGMEKALDHTSCIFTSLNAVVKTNRGVSILVRDHFEEKAEVQSKQSSSKQRDHYKYIGESH